MKRLLVLIPLALFAAGCEQPPGWYDIGDPTPPVTARDVAPIVVVACTNPEGYPFQYAGPGDTIPAGCKTPLLQRDDRVEVAG